MISKATLSLEIADKIEKRIICGKWAVGTQIPNELKLMEEFNVSRITIREAIKSLVSKGILEIHRGCGTFVSVMPGLAEDPLGLRFLKNHDNLNVHLSETRYIMEPEICRLAALRGDEEDLHQLKELVDELNQLEQQLDGENTPDSVIHALLSKDVAFHIFLCKMTKNPVLERLLPVVIHSVVASYELIRHRLSSGPRRSTHQDIYMAVRDHNGERARLLMRQHLDNSQAGLVSPGYKLGHIENL